MNSYSRDEDLTLSEEKLTNSVQVVLIQWFVKFLFILKSQDGVLTIWFNFQFDFQNIIYIQF